MGLEKCLSGYECTLLSQEDQRSVYSSHIESLTTTYISGSKETDALFKPARVLVHILQTTTKIQIQTQIKINLKTVN